MPAIYVWLLAIFLITMFSIYSMQLAARHREEDEEAGPALIEFGRAFPRKRCAMWWRRPTGRRCFSGFSTTRWAVCSFADAPCRAGCCILAR